MRVLDCGCGCGDWLDWLREQGIEGTGVNITENQVEYCRSRGLDVVLTDWKRIPESKLLQDRLYGRYDAVTLWDTVEVHIPPFPPRFIFADLQLPCTLCTTPKKKALRPRYRSKKKGPSERDLPEHVQHGPWVPETQNRVWPNLDFVSSL
jgi:SAM-dependent methyltransferase